MGNMFYKRQILLYERKCEGKEFAKCTLSLRLVECFEFDILFSDSFLLSSLYLNHYVYYMKGTVSPMFIL